MTQVLCLGQKLFCLRCSVPLWEAGLLWDVPLWVAVPLWDVPLWAVPPPSLSSPQLPYPLIRWPCLILLLMAANTFEDVVPRLSQNALDAVHSFGFSYITPVQMASIPLFLTNKVHSLP